MLVQVSGKHIDVGEALRTRISDELLSSIGKYFERGGNAEVVLTREGHSFRIDCLVTLASGQQLKTHGLGGDAHGAFDAAMAKIEARIRRYKRRLKSHTQRAESKAAELASAYVLRAPAEDEELEEWPEGESPPAAMVVAETSAEIRTMTVSMAVMELDLTDQQAIMFRNAAHGGLSVVYRRSDGNIGWIDPELPKALDGGGGRRH